MRVAKPTIQAELEITRIAAPVNTQQPQPWGWHLVMNLYQCDPQLIRSAEAIKQFVVDLCDLIDMRRFGDPIVVDFGDDPNVTGYSLLQLIETSNVSGHFVNKWNSAYIDVFSCKEFDPHIAADFCAQAFKAKQAKGLFIYRD